MWRRILISLGLVALVLGAGFGVFAALKATAKQTVRQEPPVVRPTVETIVLRRQRVVEPVVGFGSARADVEATLAAEVAGPIAEVPEAVKAGAAVRKGDLLVQIDPAEYVAVRDRVAKQIAAGRAQLAQLAVEQSSVEKLIAIARNELRIAEDEYRRISELYESGRAPSAERNAQRLLYERARRELQALENQQALIAPQRLRTEAEIEALEAEQRVAELNIARCQVVTPFDGQLIDVQADPGERVQRGTPLVSILDPRWIEVPVELPVSVRPLVEVAAPARVQVDSMPRVSWAGRVHRLSARADRRSRTFVAFVEVDNTRHNPPLVPGYFLRAWIEGPTHEAALLVPRSAVRSGEVLVVEDGLARRVNVEILRWLPDHGLVAGGLTAGQRIVVPYDANLYDGAAVDAVDAAATTTRGAPADPSE